MMKNVSYFILKTFLEIFTFLSQLFGYVEKQLNKKVKVNFKIYDVPDWKFSNYDWILSSYNT